MTLNLDHASFSYGKHSVFNDFSLCLNSDEHNPVVILGPSGCGKTSLLKMIVAQCSKADAPPVNISLVFQEPRLFPWRTVLQNVTLPVVEKLGQAEAEALSKKYLEQTGLGDKAGKYPSELSGGERQRAALARAWTKLESFDDKIADSILLMDEPFQSLDIPLRIELMDISKNLLATRKNKTLMLMVTHDPREALYLGQGTIVLGRNKIVFDSRESAQTLSEDILIQYLQD
ncbi:MAG: ATP-binding cassette domain-containing protein [Spirochaetaceae bacterium]|nr:ATP-binding cassette domain-containing protein [Spirochaetaceae bacterium]